MIKSVYFFKEKEVFSRAKLILIPCTDTGFICKASTHKKTLWKQK